jgi:hypothetical protein
MFSARNVQGLFPATLALMLFVLAGCGSQSTIGSSGSSPANETLVWSDEFNQNDGSSQPDSSDWAYRTGVGIARSWKSIAIVRHPRRPVIAAGPTHT